MTPSRSNHAALRRSPSWVGPFANPRAVALLAIGLTCACSGPIETGADAGPGGGAGGGGNTADAGGGNAGGGGGGGGGGGSGGGGGVADAGATLLQKANLIRVGAFRLPPGTSDLDTFAYGGTGLAYNPANDSLFLAGHDWHQFSAEVSIPTPGSSTTVGGLPTATRLQPFADATLGHLPEINPSDPNAKKIGGHLVFKGRLLVSGYSYYDGSGTQRASHFARPLTLAMSSPFAGPVRVGADAHFTGGYMAHVPPAWQAAFGGPALTGMCCLAIIGVQSSGPAVSVFDPAAVIAEDPVPATALVGYPAAHPLGAWASNSPLFNGTTQVTGVVFPEGSRSVLFFGRHGVGAQPHSPGFCYGPGTANAALAGKPSGQGDPWCYDPADGSKGCHAWPYQSQVWAYDALDLLAVKNGTKQPHEVSPYAVWSLDLPYEGPNGGHRLGGAAYDPQRRRLYVAQSCTDAGCDPIIHVFDVH